MTTTTLLLTLTLQLLLLVLLDNCDEDDEGNVFDFPGWTFGIELSIAHPWEYQMFDEISKGFFPDLFWLLNRLKRKKNKETKHLSRIETDTVILIESDEGDDETKQELERLRREKFHDIKRIETLEENVKVLERENAMLKKKNEHIELRSREFTSEMSRLTDVKGNFENINDDQNNSRLAQRFDSLYSTKWVLLVKQMTKTVRTMAEVKVISFLTDLMKNGYQKCKEAADLQVCNLMQVKCKEDIPGIEDFSDYLQLRRKYACREYVKENVKKKILNHLLEKENVRSPLLEEKGIQDKLQAFLNEYIECCWLMSVSIPEMVLDFNVVDKHFTDCAEHFKMYSTKKPVEDMTRIEGTVCEVVWPCVQLGDGSAIYMKGDVIVVKMVVNSSGGCEKLMS